MPVLMVWPESKPLQGAMLIISGIIQPPVSIRAIDRGAFFDHIKKGERKIIKRYNKIIMPTNFKSVKKIKLSIPAPFIF